jgi:signal transduction histidine kinase
MIGQPDAYVEAAIEPRRCVYTITPPRRNRFRSKRPRVQMVPQDFSDALAELSAANDELRVSFEEARETGESLRAQSSRLETLNRLSHELAQQTNLGELADALIALLEEYFEFDAVRLSILLSSESSQEMVRCSGPIAGEPGATHVLRSLGGVVGRVEVWGNGAPADRVEALQIFDLLPWIALVLHNARSFHALNDQTERLEAEIFERERTEQQLAHAMRMDAIGRLAGGLAHDFNNVLTAIQGHADLASRGLEADAPARRDLEEIRAISERATALTSQVLAFSRSQVLHPKPLDLNELIGNLEFMLRQLAGDGVDLRMHLAPGLDQVYADAGRLEQVIVNLVANATDAMPSGGRLWIETSPLSVGPELQLRHPRLEQGDYVRVRVRDTGTGMDEVTRERMFEPFYTTKPEGQGTGLGLSTVYGSVTHFGGSLEVDSEVGKGTTISVLLPRAEGELEVARPASRTVGRTRGTETLLFVEDNDPLRAAICRILEAEGYTVLAAADGEAALEVCRSYREPIDLLFTDVVMPGIDGHELATRVLAIRPEIRSVLYTSGYESSEDGQPADAPGDQHFLSKPYAPARLLDELREVLSAGD